MLPRLCIVASFLVPALPLLGQTITLTVDATRDLHPIPSEVYGVNTAPSARWKQIVVNKSGALSTTPDTTDGVVYLDEMVNFLTTNYGLAASGGVTAYTNPGMILRYLPLYYLCYK